ncbi:MAG: response regulator [Alphaproteobacteria bacterium]|nr:response regulator [Alphaproteobacteria bacterium]
MVNSERSRTLTGNGTTLTPHLPSKSAEFLQPRIAIIDGDEAVLDALRFLFEAHDFSVSVYASGAAFLAEPSSIALLIMDQALPDAGGLQVIRQFRRAVGATVPIVLFSKASDPEIEARAADLGVTRVLYKPGVSDLMEAVHSVMAKNAA